MNYCSVHVNRVCPLRSNTEGEYITLNACPTNFQRSEADGDMDEGCLIDGFLCYLIETESNFLTDPTQVVAVHKTNRRIHASRYCT